MRFCSFPGCKTGRISERRQTQLNNIRKKSLFRFPKDRKLREQWELAIGRKAPSNGCLCENHFAYEDIMHNWTVNLTNGKTECIERGKIRLRPKAVPFIHTATQILKPCLVCNTLNLEMISIPWHPIKLEYMLKTLLDLQPKKDDYICRVCCDAVIKMSSLRGSDNLKSETAAKLALQTEAKFDNKGEFEIITPINKIKDERNDSHMLTSDNSSDLRVKVVSSDTAENRPEAVESAGAVNNDRSDTVSQRDPVSFSNVSKLERDSENDFDITNLGTNSKQNDNTEDYWKFCNRKAFIEYENYSDRTEGSIYTITMIDESSEQNEQPENIEHSDIGTVAADFTQNDNDTITMNNEKSEQNEQPENGEDSDIEIVGADTRQNYNGGTEDYWEYWNGRKSVDTEYNHNDGIESALSSIKIIGNRSEFNEQTKIVEASNTVTVSADSRQNDNDGVEDYWEYWKSEKLDEIENNYNSDRTENSIYTILMNHDRLEIKEESKKIEDDRNIVTMDSDSRQNDSDGSENYNEYWKRKMSVDDYSDVTESTTCSIKVIGDSSELNGQLKNVEDIESQLASYVVHKNRENLNSSNIKNMKKTALHCKCGLDFRSSDELKLHKEKYTGIKHYSCSYCRQSLRSKYALRNHIHRHAKESPFLPPYA